MGSRSGGLGLKIVETLLKRADLRFTGGIAVALAHD